MAFKACTIITNLTDYIHTCDLQVGLVSCGLDSLYADIMESERDSDLQSILKAVIHPRHPRSAGQASREEIRDVKAKVSLSCQLEKITL